MKIFHLIIILFLSVGCTEKKILSETEKIVENFKQIDYQGDTTNFTAVAEALKDSDIVILGEVGHADGKTIEVKSNLAKYLIENEGFNTFATEGGSFSNLELYNIEKEKKHNLLNFDGSAFGWLGYSWEYTTQALPFSNLIKRKEINISLLGLEPKSYPDLKRLITFYSNKHNQENTDKLIDTYNKYIEDKFDTVSIDDLRYIQKEFQKILDSDIVENTFDYQIFKNMIASIDIYIYGAAGDIDMKNNVRDKNMAENIFWYKKKHPKAKIIVWTANFHGAKSIKNIRYKEKEPKVYESNKLLGEYLSEHFKVYSIAFTSSEGNVLENMYGDSFHEIKADKNTLEYHLSNRNFDFAFLDAKKMIEKDKSIINCNFNSLILAYDNKPGQWFKSFDGIFYIKKNEPATYVYE